MSSPIIEASGVTKNYPGGVKALDNVSTSIAPGEWVALMGASGSGKTTLLNLLDGLDRADSGVVKIQGVELGRLSPDESAVFRRERIGLVFQQFHLVPYLTALENVMLAQYFHSMVDKPEALRILESVGMGPCAAHLPHALSGGEQQRVCIARALVNDPVVILADEPTGNLDEENEQCVFQIFLELHAKGKTLVVATHDRELGALSGRVITLHHGKLEAGGGPASRAG
ncbi:MAG: ABC transporter ATP-binding protein [Acidobacteriota bacterium]